MNTLKRLRLGACALLVTLTVAACEDDTTAPRLPDLSLDATLVDFGDVDLNQGPGQTQTVTLMNAGDLAIDVGPANLEGMGSSNFQIVGTNAAATLGGGGTFAVTVAFDPDAEGPSQANLEIPVQGGDVARVSLTGRGQRFTFRQVDRVGIPGLNTVFNHPPQFSKTDYNTASPANDLETYRGLFETVLEAVANPDPVATTELLLPDELPVSLAGSTNFGTLTGRDLPDDAVDVALSVTVGVESLQSDNVDMNDRSFLTVFPYLAPPNS